MELLRNLLRPAARRSTKTDLFGNLLEILCVEQEALPAGLRSPKWTEGYVRVEIRRNPLDPSRIAHIAPHRGVRRGLNPDRFQGKAMQCKCACPFEIDKLLRREKTRFRIVPGQELSLADDLGAYRSFNALCTTVMGNANPAAPHQFMIISTLDHHKPLHKRPLAEVVDLLRVLGVMTQRAEGSGAKGIEIVKNRGPFAGSTVTHPHWQALILSEGRPKPRSRGISMLDLVRKESKCGKRVFARRKTTISQVVGWRSYAGFESNIAVIRKRACPSAMWISGLTDAECEAIAEVLRQVTRHYAKRGIEDYNIIVRQPEFASGRRKAPDEVLSIETIPRGPGYQPAGFELASDHRVVFVSESPEDEAKEMRKG